ncbi:Tumor necrosis factor-inducible protein 6 protein [Mactra antiquata]
MLVIRLYTSLRWARRKEDCIVVSTFKLSSLQGVTAVVDCLIHCERSESCESMSWYHNNKTCVLFTRNVLNDKPPGTAKWIALPDWKTYSKVTYPVVRRMSSDPSSVKMTFEEAEVICNEQNSRLATPDDMLAARALGLDTCYCGWLANGRNGFTTLTADSCPERGFSLDVIYCNFTEAIAWCRLNFAF